MTVTSTVPTSSVDGTPTATYPTTTGTTSTTGTGTTTASPAPKPTSQPSTAAPTSSIPPSLVGHVVSRIPTSRKVVALTFDAGANGDGVDSILATHAKEKVAATFYLTGDFVDSFPTLAVRMSAAGRLGNHTADHLHRAHQPHHGNEVSPDSETGHPDSDSHRQASCQCSRWSRPRPH